MLRALGEYEIEPLITLIPFHRAILATEQWARGETCRDLTEDREWLSLAPRRRRRRPRRGGEKAERTYAVEVDGRLHSVKVIGGTAPTGDGAPRPPPSKRQRSGGGGGGGGGPTLTSPLQGSVFKVVAEQGAEVEEGALICDRGDEDGERDHRPSRRQDHRAERLEGAAISTGDPIARSNDGPTALAGPAAAARLPLPPGKVPCAGAAAGASAGDISAPSPTSSCSARRGSASGRWARRSGRSGIATRARCASERGCSARSPAVRWTEPADGEDIRPRRLGARGRPSSCASRPRPRAARTRCERFCTSARASGSSPSARPERTEAATRGHQARRAGRVRRADRRPPDPLRGARDRGRIVRLSPAPHGLGLVRGRRAHHGRPRRAWNLVSGINDPPEHSERGLGGRARQRARPGDLRGARRDRARRWPARVRGRMRAAQG